MALLKLCNLYNPPCLVHHLCLYPLTLNLVNFVLKFPNFRCDCNKGRSGVNINDTGMRKLETPSRCNIHGSISYISRAMGNFGPQMFSV